MLPFNFHHLFYFYVIALEGSISKAAKKLRLAQPTLSTELRQLEDFLEIKLFEREKRKLVLTEEGHLVLSYAKMIFDLGQELKNQLTGISREKGRKITIGVSAHVPKTILDTLLNFMWKIEPDIFISVTTGTIDTLTKDLTDHLLDMIVTDSPFETPMSRSINNYLIGSIPIVFCAHPRIAEKVKHFPSDLNNFPLILTAAPRQTYYTIREYLNKHNLEPSIIGEIEDVEVIRRLVLRGYGIAPLNLLTIREAPSQQELVILNKKIEGGLCDKIYLLTKKRKFPHPLIERILTEFRLEDLIKDLELCDGQDT